VLTGYALRWNRHTIGLWPNGKKFAHVVHQCSYHIIWTPKYRYRILEREIAKIAEEKIWATCEWKNVELLELNVIKDHVHMVVTIPPRVSKSNFGGWLLTPLQAQQYSPLSLILYNWPHTSATPSSSCAAHLSFRIFQLRKRLDVHERLWRYEKPHA
jgi:REP element-mobilizing transposase RayT